MWNERKSFNHGEKPNDACLKKKKLSTSLVKGGEGGQRLSEKRRKYSGKEPHKRGLKEGNQETEDGEQTADEWCASTEGGVASTAGGSSAVFSSSRDGVLGFGAGEGGVLGSFDVQVRGGITQALADGLEGKFGVVFQSGIEGISGSKLNGRVMDIVLEDNESNPQR